VHGLAEMTCGSCAMLLFEYIDTRFTVRTWLFDQNKPDPDLMQTCAAFTRILAETGIYHRDYGARNMLLDQQRTIHLLDFEDVRLTKQKPPALEEKLRREFLWRMKRDNLAAEGF
jgi:tRNA A-37 threonylcarbamoyl transferase component Bud32